VRVFALKRDSRVEGLTMFFEPVSTANGSQVPVSSRVTMTAEASSRTAYTILRVLDISVYSRTMRFLSRRGSGIHDAPVVGGGGRAGWRAPLIK
jgi:hypothetical protein